MKNFSFPATLLMLITSSFATAQSPSFGERVESGTTSAQEQREKKEAVIPQCDRMMGTVAIVTPDKNWWQAYQLQSPDALIKMFVVKSKCFTVLDRGRGFAVAERERALAAGGNLQQGSNIGGGQIKAADFVITPDIVVNNNDSGGNAIGAILGSFIPGWGGIIAGQIRMSDKSAEVTLTVTDVRTSEQVLVADGRAAKTDIGFGVGGGTFMGGGFGAAGVSGYENTALGQVVALAYLDAYTKMVTRIRELQPSTVQAVGTAQAVPSPPQENPMSMPLSQETVAPVAVVQPQPVPVKRVKPVATAKNGTFYRGPSEKSDRIRDLPPGTILYPTTNTSGFWWEVEDDSGEKGWIRAGTLQLGQ